MYINSQLPNISSSSSAILMNPTGRKERRGFWGDIAVLIEALAKVFVLSS
jgi:hypothetical protein